MAREGCRRERGRRRKRAVTRGGDRIGARWGGGDGKAGGGERVGALLPGAMLPIDDDGLGHEAALALRHARRPRLLGRVTEAPTPTRSGGKHPRLIVGGDLDGHPQKNQMAGCRGRTDMPDENSFQMLRVAASAASVCRRVCPFMDVPAFSSSPGPVRPGAVT